MGEAGARRSTVPMEVAMETMTAAIPTATESSDITMLELMERNENNKRRRRSKVP
jgi:hypothetical protein